MQIHFVPLDDILVKSNRQRQEYPQASILELAGSIADSGLIHPIVLRKSEGELTLVAGGRRIKAMEHLHFMGMEFHCATQLVPDGQAPCLFLGEIDPIDAEEIELDENIKREDLTWKERADATVRLARLRIQKAERDNRPAPTVATIAKEVSGNSAGQHQENVRQDIILGRALGDPAKAAVISKASSRVEAMKLLKRHEESQRHAALAKTVGETFSSQMHSLSQADSLAAMPALPDSSFDVILTDPPYGIGADEFSDSGGKAAGGHFYDDSYDTWIKLAKSLALNSFRLAKSQAHAYVFCDVDNFPFLRGFFSEAGWKCFRTPLIWVNPGAFRAPWPESGPQRKWQAILYAIKGNRPCTRLYGDVLTYSSDNNLGHPAQKPVALLEDLLRRSVRPGDSVIDPFMGSGSSVVAGHALQCRVTGIELDSAAYGIAVKRMEELK